MKKLIRNLQTLNTEIQSINQELRQYIPDNYGPIGIPYNVIPNESIMDAFVSYNSVNMNIDLISSPNSDIYPLAFPYIGIRGPRAEIERLYTYELGKAGAIVVSPILGNEPIDISPMNVFKPISLFKREVGFNGANTLIGIVDTGIDYTHSAFINQDGKTRIVAIWDQTIGNDSTYGYGTVYDMDMINKALESPNPFEIVPHLDEIGHGTILAGIAGGYVKYDEGAYTGIAPGAQFVVVKLRPANDIIQNFYHGMYNPLGFSALDIALAFEYLSFLANQLKKPISICLPSGSNTGPHDGSDALDSIINDYSSNPGICSIISVGDEANKSHHASGNLQENNQQEVTLTIAKGQVGFITEVWAMFGDSIEVSLTSPKLEDGVAYTILLNTNEQHRLSETLTVWSMGSRYDIDTGSQVVSFRLENPVEGKWIIRVRGTTIINGNYHIWIPKTGMILPGTVLSPSDPFTTIYNTSTTKGVIAIGCYDEKSLTACSASGRGFTRISEVSPDFITYGLGIQGPLPGGKWGTISGTAPSNAITAGITSLVYDYQLSQEDNLANTVVMKAILAESVRRQPIVAYPNPIAGYGVININADII